MRGWLESDEGIDTVARIQVSAITKYIAYIEKNGPINKG